MNPDQDFRFGAASSGCWIVERFMFLVDEITHSRGMRHSGHRPPVTTRALDDALPRPRRSLIDIVVPMMYHLF